MRYIVLLSSFGLLLSGQTPPANSAPDQGIPAPVVKQEDKCTIEGSVLNSATGEPVKKATVTLRQMGGNRNNGSLGFAAASDASGHYKFENVDPGRYNMSADRTGFVPQQYGAKGPTRPGTMVTLTAGQHMTDAVFKLTPQGVMTGRIVDEDGDPVRGVMIQPQSYRYMNGKKQLVPSGMVSTNDLGEYRLFGLAPGRYYLSAMPQPSPFQAPVVSAKKDFEEGFAPLYYPNAGTVDAAAPLEIAPGAQLRGIDLTLVKTRTVRLRGQVINSTTNKPVRASVTLMGRDSIGMPMNRAFPQGLDDKGTFEMHSVPPGSYILMAQANEDNKQFVAKVPIEVSTSNIDGLQILVNPPTEIGGRVVVEGGAAGSPESNGATFNISLQSRSPGPFNGGAGAQADKEGVFRIRNVMPDAYTVNVFGPQNNFYLKSVRFGDIDVSEAGIDLTRGVPAGEISVVMSADGGQIDGTVQNEKSENAAGSTVVLIPNAERRSIQRLYKTATTDANGKFSLKGIAPGEYKLFAWEQIEAGAYQDPEFLKRYDSKGESVSIKEKSTETKQLKAIPAETQ